MAVHHMVWIKFHDDVPADRIAGHIHNLATMDEHIPAIGSAAVGENFTDRAKGFTHGLIVTVETRDDLPRYLQHPHHVKIVGPLREDAELMAMDIES